ncbi:MAG: phage terminase large subunit GpA-like protein [Polaromonas sp.]
MKFERLRWDKGQPERAAYHCEAFDQSIAEHHKTAMLEAGQWRATADGVDPTTVGYHLSALYSPVGWLSWAAIARKWEEAKGNEAALKTLKNTILGETWQESGEAPVGKSDPKSPLARNYRIRRTRNVPVNQHCIPNGNVRSMGAKDEKTDSQHMELRIQCRCKSAP